MSRTKPKPKAATDRPSRLRAHPERVAVLHELLGPTFEGIPIVADHNLLKDRMEIDTTMRGRTASNWLDAYLARLDKAVSHELIKRGGEVVVDGRRIILDLKEPAA